MYHSIVFGLFGMPLKSGPDPLEEPSIEWQFAQLLALNKDLPLATSEASAAVSSDVIGA